MGPLPVQHKPFGGGREEVTPSGSLRLGPSLGQDSAPVLVHQLQNTCATLRLSGVKLLQGLFPPGDGIADLEEAQENVRKAPDVGNPRCLQLPHRQRCSPGRGVSSKAKLPALALTSEGASQRQGGLRQNPWPPITSSISILPTAILLFCKYTQRPIR